MGKSGSDHPLQLDGLPEVLTVDEAACILRIGRHTAYDLARRWRETGGREGLPVLTLGRNLRVPRWALEEMLHFELDLRSSPPDLRSVDGRH